MAGVFFRCGRLYQECTAFIKEHIEDIFDINPSLEIVESVTLFVLLSSPLLRSLYFILFRNFSSEEIDGRKVGIVTTLPIFILAIVASLTYNEYGPLFSLGALYFSTIAMLTIKTLSKQVDAMTLKFVGLYWSYLGVVAVLFGIAVGINAGLDAPVP